MGRVFKISVVALLIAVDANIKVNHGDIDCETRKSHSISFIDAAKAILERFLVSCRSQKHSETVLEAVDNCLLKIYSSSSISQLRLLLRLDNHINLNDCLEYLNGRQHWYAKSLLLISYGKLEEALDLQIQ